MKKFTILFVFLILVMLKIEAQDYLISFAGTGATTEVGTVKVDNLTSKTTLTLNGTDILHLTSEVGISDPDRENGVFQINPNPMLDQSTLTFYAPSDGDIIISLVDFSGRTIRLTKTYLSSGTHNFRISGVKQGTYFIKVTGTDFNYSVKVISKNLLKSEPRIEFCSTTKSTSPYFLKSNITTVDMHYTDGDQLLFKGNSGIYSTIVPDVPASNKTITFDFVACNDNDGNNYPTVKIGDQTWMAANLNVGVRINGNLQQTNNGIIEKYCYYDSLNYCITYGGLYQWNEMMQYVSNESIQGICPAGWHLPSDGEWTALTTFLGGEDIAGGKIKETDTIHWLPPNFGASNVSGFTALPGGSRGISGTYYALGTASSFWTSSEDSSTTAWYLALHKDSGFIGQAPLDKLPGLSVRCLKD